MPLPTTLSRTILALAALLGSATTASALPLSPLLPGPSLAPLTASEIGSDTAAAGSPGFEPGPGATAGARVARPASRATESAGERRNLLREHTLERALERLDRQQTEPLYRYVPAPRPRDLGRMER